MSAATVVDNAGARWSGEIVDWYGPGIAAVEDEFGHRHRGELLELVERRRARENARNRAISASLT